MKQLTEGVCAESAVVSLWEGCGLRWEEDLGVKTDNLKDLLTREVLYTCMKLGHIEHFGTDFKLFWDVLRLSH